MTALEADAAFVEHFSPRLALEPLRQRGVVGVDGRKRHRSARWRAFPAMAWRGRRALNHARERVRQLREVESELGVRLEIGSEGTAP